MISTLAGASPRFHLLLLLALAQPSVQADVRADFNDDGYEDLAIGVPGEAVGDISAAGAVNIVYGGPNGESALDGQIWHRDVTGIEGAPGVDQRFGLALAAGNFNGDDFTDLAIGVPGHEPGGAVQVLYGSGTGLGVASNLQQTWTQGDGIKGNPEFGDEFGATLAAGDFDGDGFDDLAIGVVDEDLELGRRPGDVVPGAGAVSVIYGSSLGLSHRDQLWHRGIDGLKGGAPEWGDRFGSALASGDFDGDGCDDLAIGVSEADVDGALRGGEVHVLYGSPSSWPPHESEGLNVAGDQLWSQGTTGIEGIPEEGDGFGASLAAADFNGDDLVDLAVGVPGEDVWGSAFGSSGAVNIIYSVDFGLSSAQNRLWHQGHYGVAGVPEFEDEFGWSLAAGDFNADGCDDLAVGAPGEGWGEAGYAAGAVNVLYGNPQSGIGPSGNQILGPGQQPQCGSGGCTPGFAGSLQPYNHFGEALSSVDFDGDGYDDLAVGVPGRASQGEEDVGLVVIIKTPAGSSDGLSWANATYLGQGNLPGVPEEGDLFGASLP